MVEMKEQSNIEGKVEFDVIVDGVCEKRVKGLLAYEDAERDGVAIMGMCNASLAVKIILGLMKYLISSKNKFAILTVMIELDSMIEDMKQK